MLKRFLPTLLLSVMILPVLAQAPNGNVTIPTDGGVPPNPTIQGTKGMIVPHGTTAQRRSPPKDADVRVNTTTGKLEWYSVLLGGWQDAGGGGGSGNGDEMSIASFSSAGTASIGFNFCNAAASGFTLALPTAVGIAGKIIEVKKTDSTSNVVTVDPSGSETIDGAATFAISQAHQTISLISDGTNWQIK